MCCVPFFEYAPCSIKQTALIDLLLRQLILQFKLISVDLGLKGQTKVEVCPRVTDLPWTTLVTTKWYISVPREHVDVVFCSLFSKLRC